MGKPKAQQTKKTLTLKEKVGVIKYKDKSGCGSRSLAEKFFVGKTQILSILKNRDKILGEFLINKGFTDVVQGLLKVESKLEKEFVKQKQRATQTLITDFFGLS